MRETQKDALDLADDRATTAWAKQSMGSAGKTSSPLLASCTLSSTIKMRLGGMRENDQHIR